MQTNTQGKLVSVDLLIIRLTSYCGAIYTGVNGTQVNISNGVLAKLFGSSWENSALDLGPVFIKT